MRVTALLAAMLFAAVTGGCAGLNTAARLVERPAVLVAEAIAQAQCRAVVAELDAKAPATRQDAVAIAEPASEQLLRLAIVRAAYDGLVGRAAITAEVTAAREVTDEACGAVADRIRELPLAVPPLSAPAHLT